MNYFNYFSEIEEIFIRRRGRNLLLSPLDWALIESWQERGVPLHIVVGGIETVFDNHEKNPANRRRPVKNLFYCKDEIESRFAAWSEMQAGKSANGNGGGQAEDALFSDETIDNHLDKITSELKAASENAKGDFKAALEKVSRHIQKIRQKNLDAERLETELERLDAFLDESLLKNAGDAALERLRAEVAKQLAGYKNKMEDDVYRRTFDLMLLKRLRETGDIPRLSLFYL